MAMPKKMLHYTTKEVGLLPEQYRGHWQGLGALYDKIHALLERVAEMRESFLHAHMPHWAPPVDGVVSAGINDAGMITLTFCQCATHQARLNGVSLETYLTSQVAHGEIAAEAAQMILSVSRAGQSLEECDDHDGEKVPPKSLLN